MTNRRQRRKDAKERRQARPVIRPEPAIAIQLAERVVRLAYTRAQAAEALGVSPATLDRRVLPVIATVQTEWGARLIPAAELERYLAERRQERRTVSRRAAPPGRKPGVPPDMVARIRRDHGRGQSLGEIARGLNAEGFPTVQGGRQWWPSTVRAVLARSDPLNPASAAGQRSRCTAGTF